MTDILGLITGPLGWLVGAILALAGAWIAGNRQGRQRAAQKAAEDNIDTRERIDNADIVGDDPDLARRWLRERKPGQP